MSATTTAPEFNGTEQLIFGPTVVAYRCKTGTDAQFEALCFEEYKKGADRHREADAYLYTAAFALSHGIELTDPQFDQMLAKVRDQVNNAKIVLDWVATYAFPAMWTATFTYMGFSSQIGAAANSAKVVIKAKAADVAVLFAKVDKRIALGILAAIGVSIVVVGVWKRHQISDKFAGWKANRASKDKSVYSDKTALAFAVRQGLFDNFHGTGFVDGSKPEKA